MSLSLRCVRHDCSSRHNCCTLLSGGKVCLLIERTTGQCLCMFLYPCTYASMYSVSGCLVWWQNLYKHTGIQKYH